MIDAEHDDGTIDWFVGVDVWESVDVCFVPVSTRAVGEAWTEPGYEPQNELVATTPDASGKFIADLRAIGHRVGFLNSYHDWFGTIPERIG